LIGINFAGAKIAHPCSGLVNVKRRNGPPPAELYPLYPQPAATPFRTWPAKV